MIFMRRLGLSLTGEAVVSRPLSDRSKLWAPARAASSPSTRSYGRGGPAILSFERSKYSVEATRRYPEDDYMSHISTTKLLEKLDRHDTHYVEVLTEDLMSVELAQYPNPEPKQPHTEDELYVVLSGSGMAAVGDETYAIEEGDVVFVKQGVEHDFFDIEDEMTALIVFTNAQDSVLGRRS